MYFLGLRRYSKSVSSPHVIPIRGEGREGEKGIQWSFFLRSSFGWRLLPSLLTLVDVGLSVRVPGRLARLAAEKTVKVGAGLVRATLEETIENR
jgi:hypothetical protein